jgi:integrase
MAKAAFSDVFLRSVQPPSKGQFCLWDEKLPSFGLRVSQGGSKTFILNSRGTFVTIGRFPLLSLSQARTEAKKLLAENTLGRGRLAGMGYQEAVTLYLAEKQKGRRATTVTEYKRLLGRVSFTRISEITHDNIVRQLAPITSKHEYNKVLIALRILCNWLVKRRLLEHNPTAAIAVHKTHSRSRVLSDKEIKSIYEAVTRNPSTFSNIVAVLLLTGMRRGEAAAMHSSWIDEKECTITIPAHIAKNGHACELPYGELTAKFIPKTEGHLFLARTGKPYTKFAKATAKLWKISGVKGARLHDLRRTYRSNLSRCGVLPFLAERMVNHVSSRSAMEAIYDRHTYLPEMREAVNKYEAWLKHLVRFE